MAGPGSDHTVPPEVLALYTPLLARLAGAVPVDPQLSLLVDEAVPVWSRPGFETFLSVPSLRFTPFDYQLQAARSALRRMRGRAILADEVGLGKTIEACLILAELRLRGLADRSLIITPAGLVAQWQEELERKFAVPTVLAGKDTVLAGREAGAPGPGGGAGGIDRPVLIASLAAARRDPLMSALTGDQWDLIIVDEAHRVRAPRSASGKLIRALRSRHLLLLTATPVENRLQDLYEMVSLVAPGLLGTSGQFRAAHGAGGAGPGTEPRNASALRKRTAEVMIRHRRSEVSVLLPQRLAETLLIEPPAAERDWYADLGARIRGQGSAAAPPSRLALRSVARLAAPARRPPRPRCARPDGMISPSGPGRWAARRRPPCCWTGCGGRPGRRCWCSPRSGIPSISSLPRWPPRASRLRCTTAACRGRRRNARWPPSGMRPGSCCRRSPPAKAATCSSAT